MSNSKEPIRLRMKEVSGGRKSLYLDIYVNGKRDYEFLKLYVIPESNKEDREKNRQTLALADAIRARRVIDLQNHRFGFAKDFAPETNLLAYIETIMQRKKVMQMGGNWKNWRGYYVQMLKFADADTTLGDVDEDFVRKWQEFLNTKAENSHYKRSQPVPISQNTKCNYWRKFACTMNCAVKEGLIARNPIRGIVGIKEGNPERIYLTLDELKRMIETPCRNKELRRGFLFSCLTGLRISDIKDLTWSKVSKCGEFTRITFRQVKTHEQEYLDISQTAAKLLGPRGSDDEFVFADLKMDHYSRNELRAWAMNAGITKHIVFHTGRHTFATMMLELDTDIYTVQKLLGHREIRTTQRYAEVVDKKKREAVNKIPDFTLEELTR